MKFKQVVPVMFAGAALGLGVAACGGRRQDSDSAPAPRRPPAATEDSAAQARDVKVAFSAPAADHGWLKALSDNAKAKAKELGIDMTVNDSATTSAEQADQIETLIQDKPDVLVVLPNEGDAAHARSPRRRWTRASRSSTSTASSRARPPTAR